jgi:hypothetical protein
MLEAGWQQNVTIEVLRVLSFVHTPEQDQAEGYLGRVTTMASFAMVYADAPIFMWIWCIQCAVFINNITATYYSKEKVWAIPYELVHGEPYPDSSVVVPFGCAALVLLNKKERKKFKPRCAMLIFIHHAMQHPLYTYALYSPKSKQVLYRQDVIFLTNVFPMREARTKGGLEPDGESLVVYRSRKGDCITSEEDLSFADWKEDDDLPLYEDHVNGFPLDCPADETGDDTPMRNDSWPTYQPGHPEFGIPSCVKTPVPGEIVLDRKNKTLKLPGPGPNISGDMDNDLIQHVPGNTVAESQDDLRANPIEPPESSDINSNEVQPQKTQQPKFGLTDRSENKKGGDNQVSLPSKTIKRPVKDRWYYKPISSSTAPTIANDPTLPILPDHLGQLMKVDQESLEEIENDENGACSLHGTLFHDDELGWCVINGWGVECRRFRLPVPVFPS